MTSEQPETATTAGADEKESGGPLTTEQRELASLRPHPRNYRRHPERQLALLRESLQVHGQQKPVVITPDGTILAGHGLVEAAKAEGRLLIATQAGLSDCVRCGSPAAVSRDSASHAQRPSWIESGVSAHE